MKEKTVFYLAIFVFSVFNSKGQVKNTKCSIAIKQYSSEKKSLKYKSANKNLRIFYFENQFNDSISFFANDSLLYSGKLTTEFSSASTGERVKYNYPEKGDVRFSILSTDTGLIAEK